MKMILGIIAIIIVVFLVVGFYNASKLTTIEINKQVTINAPKEKVYDMIRTMEDYPKWSPFKAQDPTQTHSVKGTDGQVGVQFHWEGNKGKDLGYQEVVKLVPNSYVGIKCSIQKPFVANPDFEFSINETANGVTVDEKFQLKSGLVDAFFLWLFGVKAEMEKTNQQGLDLLKKACEA